MSLVGNKIRRCGWVLDTPDQRDRLYAAPVVQLKKLPPKVDLRSQRPKVIYDQGQLGSCTGNAIACAIQFDRLKQKRKPGFHPVAPLHLLQRALHGRYPCKRIPKSELMQRSWLMVNAKLNHSDPN